MTIAAHFPKLNIHSPKKKADLSDRESVEEFIARGGSVEQIPSGYGVERETGGRKSREYYLEKMRNQHIAVAKDKGRFQG